MEYIYPILIFIAMGILFGVLLVIVSKVFAVKVDERAAEITEKLPGANCGACGYAGCADYADAIVNKGAPMNACVPGGAGAASAIGEIMGVSVTAAERVVPVLHCNGTCDATARKFRFDGVQTCTAAKRFYGGTGVCTYGCLGMGTAFPSVKTMSSPSRTASQPSAPRSAWAVTSAPRSVPTG